MGFPKFNPANLENLAMYGLLFLAGKTVADSLLGGDRANVLAAGVGANATKNISLAAGVHPITTTLQSALTWGDNVVVNGAGRDKTILRATQPFAGLKVPAASHAVVNINSNVTLSNLTVDGAFIAENALSAFGPGNVRLENCHFMRGTSITSVFGQFVDSYTVRNCVYDGAGSNGDQQACASKNGGLFENNYMNRQNQPDGSSLTFGNGINIVVRNNTIIRSQNQDLGAAISLEPHVLPGYNNFAITGNTITNGNIKIGGPFTKISFQIPMHNIRITNNTFNNGQIWLLGPKAGQLGLDNQPVPIGLGTKMITSVVTQPNTFRNPAGKPPVSRDGMLAV